jgi:hypothetical protein
MWWIIGTLIGIASNRRNEKKNPPEPREKCRSRDFLGCLFLVGLIIAAMLGAMILGLLS